MEEGGGVLEMASLTREFTWYGTYKPIKESKGFFLDY